MTRRRFIAGAVCPACGAVDRIVVEGDAADLTRSCVVCNFRDSMAQETLDGDHFRSRASALVPVAAVPLQTDSSSGESPD
ncbi:MAG: YheV family putative metal-binding protein [Gammaproteobacteria bacterium]